MCKDLQTETNCFVMEKRKCLVSIHLQKKWHHGTNKSFQTAHLKAFVDFNGSWIRLLVHIPARLLLNLSLGCVTPPTTYKVLHAWKKQHQSQATSNSPSTDCSLSVRMEQLRHTWGWWHCAGMSLDQPRTSGWGIRKCLWNCFSTAATGR